jgi:hypothetical protein
VGREEDGGERRTVVVDEVCDANAEEGGVEPGVEAGDAFSLDYAPDGVVGGGVGTFGFDLGAGGEGDEGVARVVNEGNWRTGKGGGSRQGHGEETAPRTS